LLYFQQICYDELYRIIRVFIARKGQDVRIEVIGGGSIGLLYGARLAEAGAEVTIWTRSREQAELLRVQGILLKELDGTSKRIVRVNSNWIERLPGKFLNKTGHPLNRYRWILLTVKQTDINERLLAQLNAFIEGLTDEAAAVVCMQNGIGHLERIYKKLPDTPLFAAVTTEGAKRVDGGTVQHTGKGQLWLGEWDGNKRNRDESLEISQKMLISLLQTAGFTSFLSNDMENRIFVKLLINAVINPLTAIFDVTNGELPKHPSRESLMRALYAETEFILRQAGMRMEYDGWQQIMEVCRQTSGNVSSMLSDVRAGRTTEIDAINGGIVELAEQYDIPAPINQAVTALVKALHTKPEMKE
jgi:2-dehydropantoate 2-reductase